MPAEIGSGNGTDYPGGIDVNSIPEINSPAAGKTKARKEVIEDLTAAVIAIETELGTDPAGSLIDVKTYLQTHHQTDGTHKTTHGPHKWIDAADYNTFTDAINAAIGKTLVISSSITLESGAITIPATVLGVLPLAPGIINKGSATSLTINVPVVGNPMHQWLSGFSAGEVLFGVGSINELIVDWFGATNNEETDSTTAVNVALAALPVSTGSLKAIDLVFLSGKYRLNGAITPLAYNKQTTIRGQSKTSTQLHFNPPTTATLFSFNGGSNRPTGNGLRDMTIYGQGSATKTFIQIIEQSCFTLENVQVNNVSGTDTDSVGLDLVGATWGLEASTFCNLDIFVAKPIVMRKTGGGAMGLDHCHFEDLYLNNVDAAHAYPNITAESGVNLSNVSFSGRQAWVSGNGGFYGNGITGINVAFYNVRIESGGFSHTNPGFYINGMSKLNFINVQCGMYGTLTGFYLRNCPRVIWIGGYVESAIGSKSYDIDSTCDNVLVLGLAANQGCSPSIGTLTKIFGGGASDVDDEIIAFYQNSTNRSAANKYFDIPRSNNLTLGYNKFLSGRDDNETPVKLIGWSTNHRIKIGDTIAALNTEFEDINGVHLLIDSAGRVGIDMGASGGSVTVSAKLEIAGTDGAVLFPRLTTTQRNALTPTNGMLIYNVTDNKFQGYENGVWANLT